MSHVGWPGAPPRPLVKGIVTLAIVLSASAAAADGPRRSGFTAETGIGIGLTRLTQDYAPYWNRSDGLARWGWGGLTIGLGGFVDENTAVMLRLSGTSFQTPRINNEVVYSDSIFTAYLNHEREVFSNPFLGFVVQRWVTSRFALGGGLGVSAYGTSKYADRGVAAEVCTSFAVIQRPGWGLHVTVECIPADYTAGTVVSFAALSELQWY